VDLRSIPQEALVVLAGALALLALVQSARLALRRWQLLKRLAFSRERGAVGERRALGVLEERGFEILGRQVAVTYELEIDGEPVSVSLRADYLVADSECRYVAEVKTGEYAPRIETAATRRQLLEYRMAFESLNVGGVLLVDPEAGRVRVVRFPLPVRHARTNSALVWLMAGITVGTLVAAIGRWL
jgi:hypothetical protein